MDLERIPGIAEELNEEFSTINDDFGGTVETENGDSNAQALPSQSAFVDFETRQEDDTETDVIAHFFNKEPCCKLGPKNSPCWKQFDCETLKMLG